MIWQVEDEGQKPWFQALDLVLMVKVSSLVFLANDVVQQVVVAPIRHTTKWARSWYLNNLIDKDLTTDVTSYPQQSREVHKLITPFVQLCVHPTLYYEILLLYQDCQKR